LNRADTTKLSATAIEISTSQTCASIPAETPTDTTIKPNSE
jgi:hypothetical protein